MISRNIQADIFDILSDGKIHTMNEIAEKVEVSRMTVFRHIQALAYRFNIQTIKGGIDKGGVQLKIEQKVSVEKLNSEDLRVILSNLSLLQEDNPRINQFIHNLTALKENKELLNERYK